MKNNFYVIFLLLVAFFCSTSFAKETTFNKIKLTNSIGESYYSIDGGITWNQDSQVNEISFNKIVLFTNDKKSYYSDDFGVSWNIRQNDEERNNYQILNNLKTINNLLYFEFVSNTLVGRLSIIDTKGNTLKAIKLIDAKIYLYNYSLNIDFLVNGTYILNIEQNGTTYSRLFTIIN